MKISYHTIKSNLDLNTGYGQAGFKIVTSLQKLGHQVPFDDPSAPVQISFCSPPNYNFHPGQYKIGYTPWESTALPPGWLEAMNECDEVWATSEWTAQVYRNCGVKPPVFVYEHGIDELWQPLDRKPTDKVRFLHFGDPALRKGGQFALDAFREAFGNRSDVHMTFKTYSEHRLGAWTKSKIVPPDKVYQNVSVVNKSLSVPELVRLHKTHDVMVYPSYGEGFGLIPLQALATGMPVICTDDWAPYKKFLGPLALTGEYRHSPWVVHPGNVYHPDYDGLVSLLKYSFENIDSLRTLYSSQAESVIKEFDWLDKTEQAWEHILERFTDN